MGSTKAKQTRKSKRETLQYKVSENSTTFCLKERVLTENGRPKGTVDLFKR
ncbi:hypothetical protein ACUXJ4_002334 [Bacillus pumilus]